MQGADRINDELEVGFDQVFEHRWGRIERFGYGVITLLALAALSGLFGRGPLSHRSVGSAASGLVVDFEPIARSQCDTQVTFHLDNPTGSPTLRLFLASRLAEPMGLSRVLPEPVRSEAVPGGLVLTVAVPEGARNAELRVMLSPSGLGADRLAARLEDRAPLRWTQYVVP